MAKILAKDTGITLREHTEDVKEAARCLFSRVGDVPNYVREAVEFAVRYHDVGKVLPHFQREKLHNEEYPITGGEEFKVPHSLFSVFFVPEDRLGSLAEKVLERLPLETDDETVRHRRKETIEKILLSAIAFHHWRENFYSLISDDRGELQRLAAKMVEDEEFRRQLIELLKGEGFCVGLNDRVIRSLCGEVPFFRVVPPPYLNLFMPLRVDYAEEVEKFWIMVAGFLQRADHFASWAESNGGSLKDVEITPPDGGDVEETVRNRIKEKVKSDDIKLWQKDRIERDALHERALILVAPTGSGKSEFAFLWSAGHKTFFTLPLRAAVNQMYERAKGIFGDDRVGLLHSDAHIYLLGEGEDAGSPQIYHLSKLLSPAFIVSTGDQFFPYALRPPGYERIFATFSYSRLVVDEVQAYDPRAAAIVVKYLEFIHRMGGKFLLMTATLPPFIREAIESKIPGEDVDIVNLYKEQEDVYRSFVKYRVKILNTKRKKKNQDTDKFKEIPKEVSEYLKRPFVSRILVILNTVDDAIKMYEHLKREYGDAVKLLHSRFTFEDRRRKEDEIQRFMSNPKPPDEEERKILVATQVVEASLDIDADVLITDLAPMDALVQRMGRVQRRFILKDGKIFNKSTGRYEAPNPEGPNVLIWAAVDEQKIYPCELQKATHETLKEKFGDEGEGTISEYDRYELVNRTYERLSSPKDKNKNEGRYLKDFYDTLAILDAGFMSDRKRDAQKIFRHIQNLQVVPYDRLDDFIKAMEDFLSTDEPTYSRFRREVLNRFVVDVPESWETKVASEDAWEAIQKRIEEAEGKKGKKIGETLKEHRDRLKRWLRGIRCMDIEYDPDRGGRRKGK